MATVAYSHGHCSLWQREEGEKKNLILVLSEQVNWL